jgi:hypothetical protein
MTTSAAVATRSLDSTSTQTIARSTGLLLVLQFALQMVALVVLGSAINWPASLGEPADVVLPLIVEQSNAVALGYSSYFVSAFLLAPIALLTYKLLKTDHSNALLLLAAGAGVVASFAKLLGIGRWLFAMPELAAIYVDPQASAVTRESLAVVYQMLNSYAGGVGEFLGVMLFSGIWTMLMAVNMLRSAQLPRWLGIFGLVAAALLLVGLAEAYGTDLGPMLIIQGVVWQSWMLALSIVLLRLRPNTTR